MELQKDLVSDVLEVLSILKKTKNGNKKHTNITESRKLATEIIADKEFNSGRYRNYLSAKNTIHDALTRRLKPDINSIKEFDYLVEQWIYNNSNELEDILIGHSINSYQSSNIKHFFK